MLVVTPISMAASALVLMLAFPETPTGKWLHRLLVETPARFFMDFSWAKLGRVLLVGGAFALLTLMGPEIMMMLAASGLDAAALLEVTFIVWLTAASGGIRSAWRAVSRVAAKSVRLLRANLTFRNRARSPRSRKIRPPCSKDDQAEPDWAFA